MNLFDIVLIAAGVVFVIGIIGIIHFKRQQNKYPHLRDDYKPYNS